MAPTASTSSIALGWTTVASQRDAQKLARGLLEAKLAACVQIDGPVESFYCWENAAHADPEFRLVVKFPSHLRCALSAWIAQNHPYETPQWLSVEATDILPAYAHWVRESCQPAQS